MRERIVITSPSPIPASRGGGTATGDSASLSPARRAAAARVRQPSRAEGAPLRSAANHTRARRDHIPVTRPRAQGRRHGDRRLSFALACPPRRRRPHSAALRCGRRTAAERRHYARARRDHLPRHPSPRPVARAPIRSAGAVGPSPRRTRSGPEGRRARLIAASEEDPPGQRAAE